MADELPPFSLVVSMQLDKASMVSEMFKIHPDFSAIRMTINLDRDTYDPSRQIPDGYVSATIEIPRDVNMPTFYGEFSKALDRKSTAAVQGEREG